MNKIIFILLTVCLFSCGNTLLERHITEVEEIHTTQGQELIDFKKALDSGSITQQEYEDFKNKIIENEE